MQNDRLASLANFAETISTPSPTPVVPAPTGFQSQDLQELKEQMEEELIDMQEMSKSLLRNKNS